MARDLEGDRGATTVLVALMISGVMVGLLALGSTTGNLVWERRQLQNSADATSLKLAGTCAKQLSDCDAITVAPTLESIGDLNAKDNLQALDGAGRSDTLAGQCGRVPGAANMPLCDSANPAVPAADIANLRECPPLPTWLQGNTIKYVETYTRSESADGPFVKFLFADGHKSVTACARAAWGPVGAGRQTIPFTVSLCEFDKAVTTATVFPTPEIALGLKYKSSATCAHAPSGGDFAGGFGWLKQASCVAQLDRDSWVQVETGVGSGNACEAEIGAAVGTDVLLPIFDCANASKDFCPPGLPHGSWSYYHIKAFATFHLTATDITGSGGLKTGTPGATAKAQCAAQTTDKKCIYGYFVKATLTSDYSIDPDAPDLGTTVIKPAG